MISEKMLISKGNLQNNKLLGKVAIVTGAGRGIGYETARALIWLGANVIIAEIDKKIGKKAEEQLNKELGPKKALFIQTDVGNERSVKRLARKIEKIYDHVDIIINNAAIVSSGAVKDVPIKKWDLSYQVNLRGPVLLALNFLPGMLQRNFGVFVLVSSSGAAPYMGAYEVFKTSQVELSTTLDAELEGKGVIAFTISPGLVRTPGAEEAIEKIAPLYGKNVEEFYKMSEKQIISVEAAGAGFAAAIAQAEKYRGQEIGSIQALMDVGIELQEEEKTNKKILTEEEKKQALSLIRKIETTLREQSEGWKQRPIFERQWVLRDFRKNTGASVEQFLEVFKKLEHSLINNEFSSDILKKLQINKLSKYYEHQIDLLKGYEKDQEKLKKNTDIIKGWINTILTFEEIFRGEIR